MIFLTVNRLAWQLDAINFSKLIELNLELTDLFETKAEHNPLKALNTVYNFTPDIILLDFLMPEMDGLQVASQIEADQGLNSIPIVFMSGVLDENHLFFGKSKRNNYYFLNKPVNVNELIDFLKDLSMYSVTSQNKKRE